MGRSRNGSARSIRKPSATSDQPTRKDAKALLPELGGVKAKSVLPAAKPKPAEMLAMPAGEEAEEPGTPSSDAAVGTGAPAPAPIGLSVGFGTGTGPGGLKP